MKNKLFGFVTSLISLVTSGSSFGSSAVVTLKYESLFEIPLKTIAGEETTLSSYKGKVMLIVNVASKCGYTKQYEGLEKLYEKYKDKGLVVLGFPSNDYLGQEPGSDQEIASFCKLNFGVTFPLFSKNHVKGKDKQELYQFLVQKSPVDTNKEVGWNFEKFLVDQRGAIVNRFKSGVEPLSDEVTQAVEKLIAK